MVFASVEHPSMAFDADCLAQQGDIQGHTIISKGLAVVAEDDLAAVIA